MPDPLLLYGLQDLLCSAQSDSKRQELFLRLGNLLNLRFPNRPDLILQLIAFENAFSVLKSLPDRQYPPSVFYRNNECCIYYLHSLLRLINVKASALDLLTSLPQLEAKVKPIINLMSLT